MTIVNPKDIAAIVVDKKDKNFGKIAKVKLHDLFGNGDWEIEFANGQTATYSDKQEAKRAKENFKISTYYIHEDKFGKKADEEEWGPESFKRDYLSLNVGTTVDFYEQVHKLFK